MQTRQEYVLKLTVVDEWVILSKRNFKFDLGDVLFFPSAKDKKETEMKGRKCSLENKNLHSTVRSKESVFTCRAAAHDDRGT